MHLNLDNDSRFIELSREIIEIFKVDSTPFSGIKTGNFAISIHRVGGLTKERVCQAFKKNVGELAYNDFDLRYVKIKKGLHLHVDGSNIASFVFPISDNIKGRITRFYSVDDVNLKKMQDHIGNQVVRKSNDDLNSTICYSQRPKEIEATEIDTLKYYKAAFLDTSLPHSVEIPDEDQILDSIQIKFVTLKAGEIAARFNLS